jgi:hypothetical protein
VTSQPHESRPLEPAEHLDSDISSSDTDSFDSTMARDDSDVEMCNAVLENVEDLKIDMRARYAYNARVLEKAKGR